MATANAAVREHAWGELERLEGVKVRRPIRVDGRRPAGGEWDWFYALPRGERAAVSRDFMDPDGILPDVLATSMAMDVDEAMAHWVDCVRMTRRGGRIGTKVTTADEWGPYDDDVSTRVRVLVGDLVGPGEVAERLGVAPRTVHMWRWREVMPPPLVVLTGTALWSWPDIEAWAQATGRL